MIMPRSPKLAIVLVTAIVMFFSFRRFYAEHNGDLPELEQDEIDLKSMELRGNKQDIFEKWRKCAQRNFMDGKDESTFWKTFAGLSEQCDEEGEVGQLGLVTIKNADDRKSFVFPKNNDNSTNLITIGIGEDISTEITFQRKLQKFGISVDFYGADPMTALNPAVYSGIGQYFPFAVSSKSGISTANVIIDHRYVERNVEHKSFLDFVQRTLNIDKIDNLWIDAKFAEYELFQMFSNDSSLDTNGITICQVNIEIHLNHFERLEKNTEYQYSFMKFVRKIIADGRFGIFKATESDNLRVYMFNFQSDYCRDKF